MSTRKVSFQISIFVILLLAGAVQNIQIKYGKILDDENRQIFFHGTNVVVKVPPYVPFTDKYDQKMSFVKEDIDKLIFNGFNAIRLGVMWNGVQPQKDVYNETYLQQLKKIVNQAGQAGIYTLLQVHQFALSQSFCGIGVPAWVIKAINRYKTFPFPVQRQKYPIDDNYIPDKLHCKRHDTWCYYHAYDTAQGYQQLYKHDSYLNQKFTKLWQKIAQTFKDNKYIIAYELLNNPWVGNQFRNPALLIPGFADKLKLQGFYDLLSEGIRSVDQNAVMCFSPSAKDGTHHSGFYHPPGGNNYRDKSILCYHYQNTDDYCIKSRVQDACKLRIPSLISKTWATTSTLNKAEAYSQSWFYWIFKDFGQNHSKIADLQNNEQSNQLSKVLNEELENNNTMCPRLIRTYLQRVAGCLSYSNFNNKTGRFIAGYRATPDGESILYMNKQKTYNNKYSIQVAPKDKVQVTESSQAGKINYVTIKFTGNMSQVVLVNVIKTDSTGIEEDVWKENDMLDEQFMKDKMEMENQFINQMVE